MKAPLTAELRGQLQRIQQQLNTCQQVKLKLKRPLVKKLLQWCDEWDLEVNLWPGAPECVFDQRLIQQIEILLQAEGLPPLSFSASGKSTTEQAAVGLAEDKNLREAPSEQRLLVSLLNAKGLHPAGLQQTPTRLILDVALDQLALDAFNGLLVVENLDSFYLLEQSVWSELQSAQTLVVYRGHGQEARGCKHLKQRWQGSGKPLVYYGDFDAKGMSIALHEGYNQLLLPSADFLQQQASDLHQPAEQLLYQQSLQKHRDQLPDNHPLRPLLQLQLQQKGLKQQWFGTQPLQVYSLYKVE